MNASEDVTTEEVETVTGEEIVVEVDADGVREVQGSGGEVVVQVLEGSQTMHPNVTIQNNSDKRGRPFILTNKTGSWRIGKNCLSLNDIKVSASVEEGFSSQEFDVFVAVDGTKIVDDGFLLSMAANTTLVVMPKGDRWNEECRYLCSRDDLRTLKTKDMILEDMGHIRRYFQSTMDRYRKRKKDEPEYMKYKKRRRMDYSDEEDDDESDHDYYGLNNHDSDDGNWSPAAPAIAPRKRGRKPGSTNKKYGAATDKEQPKKRGKRGRPPKVKPANLEEDSNSDLFEIPICDRPNTDIITRFLEVFQPSKFTTVNQLEVRENACYMHTKPLEMDVLGQLLASSGEFEFVHGGNKRYKNGLDVNYFVSDSTDPDVKWVMKVANIMDKPDLQLIQFYTQAKGGKGNKIKIEEMEGDYIIPDDDFETTEEVSTTHVVMHDDGVDDGVAHHDQVVVEEEVEDSGQHHQLHQDQVEVATTHVMVDETAEESVTMLTDAGEVKEQELKKNQRRQNLFPQKVDEEDPDSQLVAIPVMTDATEQLNSEDANELFAEGDKPNSNVFVDPSLQVVRDPRPGQVYLFTTNSKSDLARIQADNITWKYNGIRRCDNIKVTFFQAKKLQLAKQVVCDVEGRKCFVQYLEEGVLDMANISSPDKKKMGNGDNASNTLKDFLN